MYTGICGRRTRGIRRLLRGTRDGRGLSRRTLTGAGAAKDIVEEMDGASVDVSVIIVADFAKRFGEPGVSIEEENEMLSQARDLYPERLIAFYGIDPQRPGSADKFEAAVKAGKVSGIKLHPDHGILSGRQVVLRAVRDM